MIQKPFSLMLFAHDPKTMQEAVSAGITHFMVDCESRGKAERQQGADTDISCATPADLAMAATVPDIELNCRINSFSDATDREIEFALENKVHRIFLPMVKSLKETEHFLNRINGRAGAAILIECEEAVNIAADLATLPLDAVYIGLNDLAISRNSKIIFEALLDGTVERIRSLFEHTRFGFGGVTLRDCGYPCPSELLLADMNRLDCHFSFLRRSYYRDIANKHVPQEITRIHQYWMELSHRDPYSRKLDKQQLDKIIRNLLKSV